MMCRDTLIYFALKSASGSLHLIFSKPTNINLVLPLRKVFWKLNFKFMFIRKFYNDVTFHEIYLRPCFESELFAVMNMCHAWTFIIITLLSGYVLKSSVFKRNKDIQSFRYASNTMYNLYKFSFESFSTQISLTSKLRRFGITVSFKIGHIFIWIYLSWDLFLLLMLEFWPWLFTRFVLLETSVLKEYFPWRSKLIEI